MINTPTLSGKPGEAQSVVVGSKAFHCKEAAIGVHHSPNMKVSVSVHTTNHFYDSHRRPILSTHRQRGGSHRDGGTDPTGL
jgi:hypothetical protein